MDKVKNFDTIIIGFGKGGKTMASLMGASGRKTALIEKSPEMYGGTCVNVGCIPTKVLVHDAQFAAFLKDNPEKQAKSYQKAMERKEELVKIRRRKNLERLNSNPNITVINGTASFVDEHTIKVADEDTEYLLKADCFIINTGSTPVIPSIDGIKNNRYAYTSDGLLGLKELPKSLLVIGGGYIGAEFSSIYADFGSKVTILQDGIKFLPREDDDIAARVRENLNRRGVQVLTGVQVLSVKEGENQAVATVRENGQTFEIQADAVLVATGRKPNTQELELANAGVEVNERGGIITNDLMATSTPHIYALGDVRGGLQFTYLSLDDFRIARSALFSGEKSGACNKAELDGAAGYTLKKRGAVPYSVFLNPPFSRVGISEKEAIELGYDIKVFKMEAAAIVKAHIVEQPDGLLKAIVDNKTGRILGAHLFCQDSHEMINLIKLAMDADLPYYVLRDMIFTHPTMSEALNELFSA